MSQRPACQKEIRFIKLRKRVLDAARAQHGDCMAHDPQVILNFFLGSSSIWGFPCQGTRTQCASRYFSAIMKDDKSTEKISTIQSSHYSGYEMERHDHAEPYQNQEEWGENSIDRPQSNRKKKKAEYPTKGSYKGEYWVRLVKVHIRGFRIS